MPGSSTGPELHRDRLLEAHGASAAIVRRTPVLTSATFSERCGGTIAVKAECLQRTGSFKLRGALNRLRALADAGELRGVVAGSAGNHGQSLAYAARHHGVPCAVFMPEQAPISKVEAVRGFGAEVHQQGRSVEECVAQARELAAANGFAFVHPFDDLEVIAGQAGVGIELDQDVADLRRVVVPVGGGGLAAGIAIALKEARPEVEVIGVQAEACAPTRDSIGGGEVRIAAEARTIADGIAIKRPGEVTLPLLESWLDGIVTVSEEEIAEAMVLLLDHSKLVVEGAGAVGLAALISGTVEPSREGTTVAVLSGGNVDIGLLAAIGAHRETGAGRRARLFTQIGDQPGSLARLLAAIAEKRANVISVEHVRDGVPLGVGETGVDLIIEGRSAAHLEEVEEFLRVAGYAIATQAGAATPSK